MSQQPQQHLSVEQTKEIIDELTFLYAQIKGEVIRPCGNKKMTTISIHLLSGLIGQWSEKTIKKIEDIIDEDFKMYSN